MYVKLGLEFSTSTNRIFSNSTIALAEKLSNFYQPSMGYELLADKKNHQSPKKRITVNFINDRFVQCTEVVAIYFVCSVCNKNFTCYRCFSNLFFLVF